MSKATYEMLHNFGITTQANVGAFNYDPNLNGEGKGGYLRLSWRLGLCRAARRKADAGGHRAAGRGPQAGAADRHGAVRRAAGRKRSGSGQGMHRLRRGQGLCRRRARTEGLHHGRLHQGDL